MYPLTKGQRGWWLGVTGHHSWSLCSHSQISSGFCSSKAEMEEFFSLDPFAACEGSLE